MLGLNPIKAIAFAMAFGLATVCVSQDLSQKISSRKVKKEFRKADVNPCDSFVSQAELNAYMGNTLTKVVKYDVSKDSLLDIDEFAPIVKIKKTRKNIKQLYPEYIHFVPATTMQEAIIFAKENFGTTLKLEGNLVAANFINQLLTNLNNKMQGTSILPREVVIKKSLYSRDLLAGAAGWENMTKSIYLGPYFVDEFKEAQKAGKSYDEVIQSYIKKSRNPRYSRFYTESLRRYAEYKVKTIYHEMGHANHHAYCKNAGNMGRLDELKKDRVMNTHFTQTFLNDVANNDVVKKFFGSNTYPLTSPAEFVAEVFAYKIMGKQIPKEVDELYDKYGGMPVPD